MLFIFFLEFLFIFFNIYNDQIP